MTLRTTSVKRQNQAWALLALVGLVTYFVLVLALGLGNPLRFFGPQQMRVLIPLVVILRLLAREFRWDGVVRVEEKKVNESDEGGAGGPKPDVGRGDSPADSAGREAGARVHSRPQSTYSAVALTGDSGELCNRDISSAPATCASSIPQPSISTILPQPSTYNLQPALPPSDETAETLWKRAREMVHSEIPDPQADYEYIELIISAAERGYVPALAKLGDYAYRRRVFVEAYFWTTMAKCRLELSDEPNPQWRKEIADMLRNIRRTWIAAGQPLEFGNVYNNFPEERGELGRAFLRLANQQELEPTRDYIRLLAENGNPDALLFSKAG